MADADKIETRYHYYFIHNVFGHFFQDTLQYFSSYLYPRFEWTVVGTYDKAVEYIDKQTQLGREADKPNKPALILNPSGEFDIADSNTGAKQLYRFPNLSPGFITKLYLPIYQDENLVVTPGFSRFKGEIELIMLCPSFYEYCDLRVYLLQVFGGKERWIYPQWFNSFLIIPEELINYTYTNDVTNVSYQIDWENNQATTQLVKTTAQNELVLPLNIMPSYRLMSISDGSERYGGPDRLAEWKLTGTLEYEVEFPTYTILMSDSILEDDAPIFTFGYESVYSEYPEYNEEIPKRFHDIQTGKEAEHNIRYYHRLTQSDLDSTSNIEITIPQELTTDEFVKVVSRYGPLSYGDHYVIENQDTLILYPETLENLEVGDFLELHVYKYVT